MEQNEFQRKMNIAKRAAERSKRQPRLVRFRPNEAPEKYAGKLHQIAQFLRSGSKVKAAVFFRTNELTELSKGHDLLGRLTTDLAEFGTVESLPKFEKPDLTLSLSPKR